MGLLHHGLLKLWTDPSVTGIHKLAGHSGHRIFPGIRPSRKTRPNPWEKELDGFWDFVATPNPEAAEAIITGKRPTRSWGSILVPGHPELQGFGKPHYTNIQMPFPGEPPEVPNANPTGVYRKRLRIPRSWTGMRMILHVASAESFLAVWANRRAVGISKGSRLPAEFDLTPLARPGRSLEIRMAVAKWSDASFLEDQDMWWLSGLPRTVKLIARPAIHAGDIFLRPILKPDGHGLLEAEIAVAADSPPKKNVKVTLQLRDSRNRPVFRRPLEMQPVWSNDWIRRDRGIARFRAAVPGCRAWSHETPVLYRAEVSVRCGKISSHSSIRIGFRRVEVRDGKLLLNGKRVLIFGVNRHSHDPKTGRAVSHERMQQDIALLKKYHFNAVRCSHYPPDPFWLDLCDEAGIYVIDEADLETHAFYHSLCRDPRYAGAWLDRTQRMVLRDKNHPSVMAWSLGNESGYGPSHDAAAGWIRHYDPTRPLHYEGAIAEFPPQDQPHLQGGPATDFICPMYPSLDRLRLREQQLETLNRRNPPRPNQRLRPQDRPILLCEYNHCMGNSNGSLADYFDLFRSSRRIQGGFLWEWADHGLLRRTTDGRTYFAYGGDYGDHPNDANFVCDGLVNADRRPHPALEEHRYLAQPLAIQRSGRNHFRLQNRQSFTGTNWLQGEWSLREGGKILGGGRLHLPQLSPGASSRLPLPVKLPRGNSELFLNFRWLTRRAHGGFRPGEEVGRDQIQLRADKTRRIPTRPACQIDLREERDRIIVSTKKIRAVWDRKLGSLLGLWGPKGRLFSSGPEAALWRGPVDNDGIKLLPGQQDKPLGRWRRLGLDQIRATSVRFLFFSRRRSPVVEFQIRANLSGRNRPGDASWMTRVRWDAEDSFWVEHDLQLKNREMTDLPRIGATWVLASGLDRLRYYGRGPQENYPDRQRGALIDVYESRVKDEYFPYVMPQETGHHGDLRWLELRSYDERGLLFDFSQPLGANALHHTAEDFHQGRHTTDLRTRPEIFLTIDAAHRGLGSASCGPDTLPQYRLQSRRYRWSYRVTLLTPTPKETP